MKAYSPVNRAGSPHLFTKSNLTEVEYNRKHAHFTYVKHINIIRKLVPSAKGKQFLGDAGTIDSFGLGFFFFFLANVYNHTITAFLIVLYNTYIHCIIACADGHVGVRVCACVCVYVCVYVCCLCPYVCVLSDIFEVNSRYVSCIIVIQV